MYLKRMLLQLTPKTSFGKGVVSLTSGTVVGQLLLLAAAPVLTRLYSTEDFGAFGVFVSLVSILSVVSSLRYQIAIPIPEDEKKASNLTALAFTIVIAFTAAIACLIHPAKKWLVSLTNTPAIGGYLWLLPIAIFLVGSYQVLNHWALRSKAFRRIGHAKAAQGGSRAVAQIGLGPLAAGPSGLIGGYILGWLAAAVLLGRGLRRQSRLIPRSHLSIRGVAAAAKEYRRFPLFSSWSAISNTLSVQLPTILLASFFGPAIAGFYSLTRQVLSAPMQFVGQAVSQAFLSEAPGAARDGRLRSLTMGIFRHLVGVAIPVCLVLGIAAPAIFSLIFGAEWRVSGIYCQWLTAWLFLVFVSSPLSMIPSIMGKQQQEFAFHATLLVARIAALLGGFMLGSPAVALGLFAVVSSVCWFWFMLWNLALTGNRVKEVLITIAHELWPNVLLSTPIVACRIWCLQEVYVVGAAAVSGLLMAIRLVALLRGARNGVE